MSSFTFGDVSELGSGITCICLRAGQVLTFTNSLWKPSRTAGRNFPSKKRTMVLRTGSTRIYHLSINCWCSNSGIQQVASFPPVICSDGKKLDLETITLCIGHIHIQWTIIFGCNIVIFARIFHPAMLVFSKRCNKLVFPSSFATPTIDQGKSRWRMACIKPCTTLPCAGGMPCLN